MQDTSKQILNKAINEAIAIEAEQLKKDYDTLMISYNKIVETNRLITEEKYKLQKNIDNLQTYKNKYLSIFDECSQCQGEGGGGMCDDCGGRGFIPKSTNPVPGETQE